MDNLFYVHTYHSVNGGWNGTYGFRTLQEVEAFRKSYEASYPGSRTELAEENIDNG
jgi:hypothetical protein